MIGAFLYAQSDWKICVGLYLMAFVGDVVDGYVARAFNQCTYLACFYYIQFVFTQSRGVRFIGSKFGGILDMVTDRVSTCGLLVMVSQLYPQYAVHFALLIVLDISSHWFHVMRYLLVCFSD